MKNNKMFLIVVMLLPWLSLPLLGKRALKRFYPGALFIIAWVAVESIFAKKKLWWRFYTRLIPNVLGEFPFFGPFFVGSLWILKFTYGKFSRYFLLNFIVDAIFVYPGMIFLRKMGIVTLVNLKHYQMGILFLAKSVLMYGFQGMVEKVRAKPKTLMEKLFTK